MSRENISFFHNFWLKLEIISSKLLYYEIISISLSRHKVLQSLAPERACTIILYIIIIYIVIKLKYGEMD